MMWEARYEKLTTTTSQSPNRNQIEHVGGVDLRDQALGTRLRKN